MTRPRRLLTALAAVLAVAAFAAGCGGGSGSVPDGAVAVVDGTSIPRAELDRLIDRTRSSYESQKRDFPKAGTAEYQALQAQAVTFLVQQEQYRQEAEALGLAITEADIDKELERVRKQFFDGNQKKLEEALAKQDTTIAELRSDIRARVLATKLTEDATKGITVSAADIRKYYDDNKSQYEKDESRSVRHILLAVKDKNGGVDYPKSLAQADDVRAQLVAGGDFAALAKKYSQDPGSKDNGGKYEFTRGQTVPAFDKASFTLDTNELSQPVKTEFGYHLIEPLAAVKPKTTQSFESVKAAIKSQLLETKKNDAVSKWAADIRAKYEGKVAYATGFEPPSTGDSSDTTG